MNHHSFVLFLVSIIFLPSFLSSCGNKIEEPESVPVIIPPVEKKRVVKKAPVITLPSERPNVLAKWGTPEGDMKLITEPQSANSLSNSGGSLSVLSSDSNARVATSPLIEEPAPLPSEDEL